MVILPNIGYTELNETIFNVLQHRISKLKSYTYKNFLKKNTNNKKYISWNFHNYNEDFNSYYFCNRSLRQYYSLKDLNLINKIYELW